MSPLAWLPVPIDMGAEWAPKPVPAFWRRQKYLPVFVAHKNIQHYRDYVTNWAISASFVESVGSSIQIVLVCDATEEAVFWGNLPKFRPKRRCLFKKLHGVVSQKTACETIQSQMNYVRFRSSVQLVNAFNLRQMNHARLYTRVFKTRIADPLTLPLTSAQ